jgi:succinate dehydrogenase/fumarate reductase flavoprotein subunit
MGGVHGANRLGGNALAETFVFGTITGSLAAQFAKKTGEKYPVLKDQAQKTLEELTAKFDRTQRANLTELEEELKSALGECAGVIRDQKKMEYGLKRLERLEEAFSSISIKEPQGYWPILAFQHKLLVSEMILKSAYKREETRGAHFREDFPLPDDKNWRVNICIHQSEDKKMEFSIVPVGP